jgi:hypothetical protein
VTARSAENVGHFGADWGIGSIDDWVIESLTIEGMKRGDRDGAKTRRRREGRRGTIWDILGHVIELGEWVEREFSAQVGKNE